MAKISWSAKGEETATILQRARDLHDQHGQSLARHPRIPALLDQYRQAIDLTSHHTVSLGVPSFCITCALKDGVCCFRGVERRYDEYLLLVNMLLGDQGLWDAGTGSSCFFCGAQGCSLLAKHSFCLNFYCADIKLGLGDSAMGVLNRQVGQELSCQWELERVLMPWLWGAGAGRAGQSVSTR
jgi:hypothetical protein